MGAANNWVAAVARLRAERCPAVLVTVTSVRGHAPREAGAKMVVAASRTWGTIGGGNLEETAIDSARAMLAEGIDGGAEPRAVTVQLNDRTHNEHGRQCCGGEVGYLLEPLPVVPSVAVFGIGHVGLELARILSRHDLELHLVDSRPEQVSPDRLACLDDAVAAVHTHHPMVPELVLGQVPAGTDVLVMTHDHAEDFALCDAALRCGHLGSIGLIGSAVKWGRFQRMLAEAGHSEASIARIQSPIGLPELTGKQPALIAVSVAAQLLGRHTQAPAPASASAAELAR